MKTIIKFALAALLMLAMPIANATSDPTVQVQRKTERDYNRLIMEGRGSGVNLLLPCVSVPPWRD